MSQNVRNVGRTNELFINFTLPIFGINFRFHSLMIEKALLVYRRRLDKKKKTKQCITQNHQLRNAKKKKAGKKKKRTVKELVSTKTVKCNREVEKHKNGHKGLTFES